MVANRLHADAGQHTCRLVERLECTGESKRVDAGGKHAHLVAFHAVKTALRATQAAEDIASADNDGYLYACLSDGAYLLGILLQPFLVDAVLLLSHETFTGKF